jgi:hypothetical protein
VRVIADLSDNNPDDPDHYMKFDEMGDDSETNILFAHLGAISNPFFRHQYRHFERKVSWCGEQPCAFATGRKEVMGISADLEDYFNTVYTPCPYTANWLNEYFHKKKKFELACVAYNENEIPKVDYEKEFDAIYWGGLHSKDHLAILEAIRGFKSNFFTIHPRNWTVQMDEHQWHRYMAQLSGAGVPHRQLWKVLAKTKIFISTNILPLRQEHINSIKTVPLWEKNEAFSHVDQFIAPQMKTRPFAAAFNRSLNLIKRDPWNVIEYFFEPDVDFIYFDNYEDLPEIIRDITNNWDDYQGIIDNAFEKAVSSYTCQILFETMRGEEERETS